MKHIDEDGGLPCVWLEKQQRSVPYDIYNLTPEVLQLDAIAGGLSDTIRFGGHTPFRYSVAMHSIFCSYLVPEELALEALMHDAEEAYLGDLIRPIKRLPEIYPVWKRMAGIVDAQIRKYYYLRPEEPVEVKAADRIALLVEQCLLRERGEGVPEHHDLFRSLVMCLQYANDYDLFISRYTFLTQGPDAQIGEAN